MPEKEAPHEMRKLAGQILWDEAEHSREFADLLKANCPLCAIEPNPYCTCPIPGEWVDAFAHDLDGAVTDRRIEWFRTLKAGRPATTFVVEWEAEVRECETMTALSRIGASNGRRSPPDK